MILLEPPSCHYGNLGDEAMILGILDESPKQFGLRTASGGKRYGSVNAVTLHDSDKEFPSGYEEFWYCGGDVLDGKYNDDCLLHLGQAMEANIPIRVLGFSWSNPKPKNVEFIKSMKNTRFFIRDEFSLQRFTQDTGLPATLVSDLAFLAKSKPIPKYLNKQEILEFIDGDNTIMVNVSKFANKLSVFRYADVLNELNTKVLIVYHDLRDFSAESEVVAVFNRRLKCRRMICRGLDSRTTRWLCERVDLVLSFRLHLAITALSVGTPVLSIDYNDKMPGIFKQFDCEDCVVKDFLPTRILEMLDKKDEYRAQILERLPSVMTAARLNIA